MKPVGTMAEAEAKRARHRKFTWCRLRNDFVDMPLWRVVAAELGLPLYQVQAFVVRLESFANATIPRGYVGDFSAAEFGAALGMPAGEAARIFELLERDDVGWVLQSHVATFWERNPDKEDSTATERKQRERSFKGALKDLAALARQGRISEGVRLAIEKELHALRDLARSGDLPWSEHRARQAEILARALSTGHGGHNVTDRDIVTVTPRAEQKFRAHPVDNSGGVAPGETAGSAIGARGTSAAPPQDPNAWLAEQGSRIVGERLSMLPSLAATKVERWKRELAGNAEALAAMIEAADHAGCMGAAFLVSVTDQIKRRLEDERGPRLPLVRAVEGGGAA